ncbi:MAG: hypothetical protein K6F34_04895 [Lachnospiraceae bacterium]|nr:hypothetical protein [Lachnospiraceae bacterium]
MPTKTTEELEKVLNDTHLNDTEKYLKENAEDLLDSDRPFSDYMKSIIKKKNLVQQNIFIKADIPDRYGYKLLSEEKHTKQRDVILRLCYAAEFTLEETQKALRIYGMPELYARVPRDAVLMIIFNNRPGGIIDVNAYLKKNGVDILRSSGVQD